MTKQRSLILRLIGFSLLIVAIFIANKGLNYGILLTALDDVSALHLTLASIVIFIVMALSTSRFALINRKFGGNEDWLFLHRVNMLSILYSQIALPLIAQIIGRVAHGSLAQRQNYASMTVIEKSIAFAIMAALGGSASFLLLNKNIIPSGLFSAFILLGGAIAITVLACYLVFFDTAERSQIIALFGKIPQLGILRIIGLSLTIQLGILLVYTILALQFVHDANIELLIGGFAIVILATAVPLGLGGWGVREAAAAGVFLALGMPPEIGIIVGLLYGLLHLIILTISVYVLRNKPKPPTASSLSIANPFHGVDFWPITLFFIVILLPFQIRLPLASGQITLNSADILALIVMCNFTLTQLLKGTIQFIWRDHLMWFGIAGFFAMLMVGWFVGYLRFGSNEWATGSRLLGFISVLSYLFAGAAMRHLLSLKLLQKLALLFSFSIIMSAGIKYVAYNILGFESAIFFNWTAWTAQTPGFIADRNAFCFMAGLSAVLLIFTVHFSPPNKRLNRYIFVLMSIIVALMIFANSRTGFAAAAVLALWMFVFLPKHFPKIIIVSVLTALISISWWFNNWTGFVYPDRNSPSQHIEIGTFKTLEECRNVAVLTMKNNGWANKGDFKCGLDYNISAIFKSSLFQHPIQFREAQTQNNFFTLGNERFSLLSNGYQMFLDYPLFGAGLGASINETDRAIHNLYLWIFGEMGLVGVAFLLPLTIAFFRTAWQSTSDSTIGWTRNTNLHAYVIFIIICGGFSLFHDVAYQRTLWLMMGFMMAKDAFKGPMTEKC